MTAVTAGPWTKSKSHKSIRFVAIRYKGSRFDGDFVDIMELEL